MKNNKIERLFDQKFNKDSNFNQIINSFSKKEKLRIIFFKYSLIPLCLLFIIGIIIFNNKSNIDLITISGKTNNIIINNGKNPDVTNWYCMGGEAIEINTLTEKYNFIKNLSVPAELTNISSYTSHLCGSNDIEDYNLYYQNIDKTKTILISYSDNDETLKTLRGYFLKEDDLKDSTISNVKVKIIKYAPNYYFVSFNNNKIYYNIQTTDIEMSELVPLIESILK